MKITKSSAVKASSITAAKTGVGTTFYKATLSRVMKALEQDGANIWMIWAFQELGFDAIDFSHGLFGSQVRDVGGEDVLYICVTDGYDIEVNGNMEDPEEALDYFGDSELADYIEEATNKIITDHITEYEIFTPQFDKWAPEMLRSGYSFTELADAKQDGYWD